MVRKYYPPYKRNCPSCNVDVKYANAHNYGLAFRNNSTCISCSKKGKNNYNYQGIHLLKGQEKTNHRRSINYKYALKSTYNITVDSYNLMYDNQSGCCAICGTHQSELKRSLCVDHCHDTNRVRGLLCHGCNFAIGFLKDSIANLNSAIKYLKENGK